MARLQVCHNKHFPWSPCATKKRFLLGGNILINARQIIQASAGIPALTISDLWQSPSYGEVWAGGKDSSSLHVALLHIQLIPPTLIRAPVLCLQPLIPWPTQSRLHVSWGLALSLSPVLTPWDNWHGLYRISKTRYVTSPKQGTHKILFCSKIWKISNDTICILKQKRMQHHLVPLGLQPIIPTPTHELNCWTYSSCQDLSLLDKVTAASLISKGPPPAHPYPITPSSLYFNHCLQLPSIHK